MKCSNCHEREITNQKRKLCERCRTYLSNFGRMRPRNCGQKRATGICVTCKDRPALIGKTNQCYRCYLYQWKKGKPWTQRKGIYRGVVSKYGPEPVRVKLFAGAEWKSWFTGGNIHA